MPYRALADAVLVLHAGIVGFVVIGLVAVLWGNRRGWPWVNALGFRVAHLGAIGVVMAEAWLGIVCPLTTLEMWLRAQAGAPTYDGSFVEHWLQRVLYWDLAGWIFVLAYTLFALAVALAWWRYPPRRRGEALG